jgi:hypothetical protein
VLEFYPRSETILVDAGTGIHFGFQISADSAVTSPLNSEFNLDFDRPPPFELHLAAHRQPIEPRRRRIGPGKYNAALPR